MNDGYAICLNEWALDTEIKNELGLLLIISSLCAERGFCYASNDYLAEIFKTTDVSISRKLKTLADKNYIKITYEKRGCEVTSRHIRLTKLLTDDYQICKPTINKNVKENNTSINNTRLITYIVPKEIEEEFEEYTQMRKLMKRPLTAQAKRRALSKLETLSPGNYEIQKKILNQSVDHSWLGLFPLKDIKEDTLPKYDPSKNKKISDEELEELLSLRGK